MMLQLILCMLEGVEGGLGWGEAGGWMPLRYRDPASLAYWLDLDSYMQRLYQANKARYTAIKSWTVGKEQ